MSREETPEEEAALNAAMYVGHAAECENLAADYRSRAGMIWSGGNEHVARYLRDVLVPELDKRAKEYRQRQKEQEERVIE